MKKVILMQKQTIKEIKSILEQITEKNDPRVLDIRKDDRKGVKDALLRWEKGFLKQQELAAQYEKMSIYEKNARAKGANAIAGIDEVGRGPLAGPVLAAAVILDLNKPIIGLNDSKKLSLVKRLVCMMKFRKKLLLLVLGSWKLRLLIKSISIRLVN